MKSMASLMALALLAACGRVGPPRPPGPVDQVTFPRPYPAPDPIRPANGTAAPATVVPAR